MALPIRTVVRPAILVGVTVTGRLPSSALWDTPGLAGGPVIRLVPPAARAWRAMTAAASAAGHTLKATSAADSYRSYEIQERVFRQRYTTSFLSGRPYRTWNGVRWYQRPGTAPAAVPGTSNHGLGLAVDVGEERDADTGTESMDAATLAWLVAHELTYGWSHELESEPWHIRYTAGDQIPAAVLAYEQGDDDMPTAQEIAAAVWAHQIVLADGRKYSAAGSQYDGATAARNVNEKSLPEAVAELRDRLGRMEVILDTVAKALAAENHGTAVLAPGTILEVQSIPNP